MSAQPKSYTGVIVIASAFNDVRYPIIVIVWIFRIDNAIGIIVASTWNCRIGVWNGTTTLYRCVLVIPQTITVAVQWH